MHEPHRVQLYRSRHALVKDVVAHLNAALVANGGAIAFARADLHDDLVKRFAGDRVVLLPVERVIDEVVRDGFPSRERFRAFVGGLLDEVRGSGPIHIYGEVVDVLWARGQRGAVLVLEQLWHELGRERPFELLCGYDASTFGPGEARELDAICSLHDHVAIVEGRGQGSVVALVERAHQLETEVARRERLEKRMLRLLAVTGELAAAQSRDEIVRLAVDGGRAAVDSTSATLWLLRDGELALAATSDRVPGKVEPYRTLDPALDTPIGHALRTRAPVFLGSRAEYCARFPESYARVAPTLHDGELALAILPVAAEREASPTGDNGPFGALCFAFDHVRVYEDADRAFKAVLVRQVALALERVHLQAEERAQREAAERAAAAEKAARIEAELLYEVTGTANALDDLEPIYDLALDAVMRGAGSLRAAILVLESDGVMRFKASRGLSDHYRQAVEGHSPWKPDEPHPAPVVVEDTETDPAWQAYRDVFRAERIRALAFVPLVHHRKLIGKLMLYRDEPRPFSASELQLTSTVAIHVAQAIERKRGEQELARAYRVERDAHLEAEEATRAREEILSVVSHDLRNPLSAIIMGASMLLASESAEKRARMVAERIHRQAERMTRLIEDLVDFAGIQAGRIAIARAKHAPEEIIAAARDLFGPIAEERGLELEALTPPGLPAIECDSERAVQVISNLVANALKVTPRGGRIAIGVEPQDRQIVFYVKDTGPGIDPDDLPNLFERFWRGKKSNYRGAGLGLSIARGIVDAHGGRIWAESTLGSGSTFYFSLSSLQN
jgi:signal transduction histidine kinase